MNIITIWKKDCVCVQYVDILSVQEGEVKYVYQHKNGSRLKMTRQQIIECVFVLPYEPLRPIGLHLHKYK